MSGQSLKWVLYLGTWVPLHRRKCRKACYKYFVLSTRILYQYSISNSGEGGTVRTPRNTHTHTHTHTHRQSHREQMPQTSPGPELSHPLPPDRVPVGSSMPPTHQLSGFDPTILWHLFFRVGGWSMMPNVRNDQHGPARASRHPSCSQS